MKVALFGAGLIGRERLAAIEKLRARGGDVEICGVYDPYAANLQNGFSDIDALLACNPDWVIVATPHDVAPQLCVRALRGGFKVLVEKPLGRDLEEAERIFNAATRPDQLWAGFNYRFYPGIAVAIADATRGTFGPLVSVNMTLGHGCDPNILKTWKLDPVRAGGGCLIDPGVHLLDLCKLISRNPLTVSGGYSWNGFWKTGVEEECRLLLDAGGFPINLEISIVRWRSVFRLEIHGQDGYGIVTGRNRSYGKQTYVRGRRWGWQSGVSQAESEERVLESPGEDVFADEMDSLFFGAKHPLPACSGAEALETMRLLERCRERVLAAAAAV
ncbi:MAG TPA: Gfo/Idh/MocA family oxidoreductase [Bryobacteraceae bacterium]|jgi:predicted dehydrogenase